MRITGERIVTNQGGFNPTWQRHTVNYRFAAAFLPRGTAVDLGCGTGHAAQFLADRWTVGVDIDHGALAGQRRPTVLADLRRTPFAGGSFDGAVCLHAVEHVPDPERVVAECARLVRTGGTAVLSTPNRLTFLRNSLGFSFDSEMLMQAVHFGFRIAEIPARSRYFDDASSIGLKDATAYGVKTAWMAGRFLLNRWGALPCRKFQP